MANPTLYALLIGINEYTLVSGLKGPKNDVNTIKKFLAKSGVKNSFSDIHVQELLDAKATKQNIIDGFEQFLSQGKEGDVCLFFFGGHGIRELTSIKSFKDSETDGKIGSLVCVDSNPLGRPNGYETQTCLADKELRYLIANLAKRKVHILTLFDCCHSGDNTRAIGNPSAQKRAVRQILDTSAFTARGWKGFFFHDKMNENDFQTRPLTQLLPQGEHIQMAACREAEKAEEIPWDGESRDGLFTKHLFEALENKLDDATGIGINFHDLQGYLRNSMRNKKAAERQNPQMYFCTTDPSLRFKTFLTFQEQTKPIEVPLVYNSHSQEWSVGLGVLNAVNEQVTVTISPDKEPNIQIPATLGAINLSDSTVIPSTKLDGRKNYSAVVTGLAIKPLKVYVKGKSRKAISALGKGLSKIAAGKQKTASGIKDGTAYYKLVATEEDADYCLVVSAEKINITTPYSPHPLVESTSYSMEGNNISERALEEVYQDLVHMARWTFLKDLENNGGSSFPLSCKVYQEVPEPEDLNLPEEQRRYKEVPLQLEGGEAELEVTDFLNTDNPLTRFRVELTNPSGKRLFTNVLFMSSDYSVGTNIMEQGPSWLEPNSADSSRLTSMPFASKFDARNNPIAFEPFIRMGMSAHFYDFKQAGDTTILKIIASNTQFSSQELEMEGLPKPTSAIPTRGNIHFRLPAPKVKPQKGWYIQTIKLYMPNHKLTPSRFS